MEEDGEDSTPFWLQSSTDPRRGRRASLSSFFLNSGLLIFLLCSSAVIFMFFIVPSVVSLTDRIFRPNLVKKSWDSVNIVLVLLALVFGFLSRNRNHDSNFDENHPIVSSVAKNEIQKSNPSTPRQWYEYSDPTVYSSSSTGGGIRRNSCSYPDLRDASPWGNNADDNWRFSDDTRVDAHRYSDSDQYYRRRSWKRVEEEEEEEESSDRSKTVQLDTLVTPAKEVPYTPPPPPSASPPPPPTAIHREPKRTFDSTAHRVKGPEPLKTLTPTAVTPPPPLPPPVIDSEIKNSGSERKRGGGNATKDLFTSIYHQGKKKKKQRQKSVDNFQTLVQSHTPPLNSLPPPSPPPPPPPPPPPSVFQNLFSAKKAKSKKVLRVPPPDTTVRASKTTALVPQIAAREPPLPAKISNFNSGRESPLTGCESPLIPLPPPPPPPFKMPSWRFVVKGDYVKVGSMNSSRSVSPDHDGGDSPTSETSSEAGGTPTAADCRSPAPLFCHSPDVDTKADMFIAKFRAGLKLQKMNSMVRQKHGLGLSNLGPETKPGPRP